MAGCENVYRLTPKVMSGGEPHGEPGFRALSRLGVRTLISVDGAKPSADLAARYGLRYVHLPVGYDGIPPERIFELARAMRDLDGPIYLHCHHGLHRGPAAAAAALVALGEYSNEEAIEVMTKLGTSPKYEGLYGDVREAKAAPENVSRAGAEFPSAAKLPGFVAAMAAIDRRLEHLKEIGKAAWRKSPVHPDIDPPHEARLFKEMFAELERTEYVKSKNEKFRGWMTDTVAATADLENAIRRADTFNADKALRRIEANCRACHEDYRNRRKDR